MAAWGWIGVAYGAFMAALAVAGRARRGALATGAAVTFAVASALASMVAAPAAQVILPGAIALAGYWLCGWFIGAPQSWLERRLLDSDAWLFRRLRIDPALTAAPLVVLEFIELAYATVYVVVMAGSVAMALQGSDAVRYYWTVVLPSGFICYAALPFLRSRPPRSLETPGVIARRAPVMRRLNDRIVSRGSIQVNTIPSGHVAVALAAGLATWAWWPLVGAVLGAWALLIAVAATLGRYHYAIDCLLGAVVAIAVWMVV